MRKVIFVTGALVAAGTVAALSAPDWLGFDEGGLFGDVRQGSGRQHRVREQRGARDRQEEGGFSQRRSRRQRDGSAGAGENSSVTAELETNDEPRRERGRRGKRRSGDGNGDLAQEEFGGGRKGQLDEVDAPQEGDAVEYAGGRRSARRGAENIGVEDGPRRPRSTSEANRSTRQFQRFDRNNDGVVDREEFETAAAERIAGASKRFFKRFDLNGDGKVTREEFSRVDKERVAARDEDETGTETDLPPRMRGRDRMR